MSAGMLLAVARFGPALALPAVRLASKCRQRSRLPVYLHRYPGDGGRHVFGFSRQRTSLHLAISRQSLLEHAGTSIARISAMSAVLARCAPGTRGLAEFSDGECCGDGVVSMCGNRARSVLIPDNEFVQTRGYAWLHRQIQHLPAFEDRRDVVLWRGTSTGKTGAISLPGMTADTPGLLLRTRMCLLLKDVAGCDVRISAVAQSGDVLNDVRRLAQAGILGHHIDPLQWLGVRYHIAVDGNTLAWSSTFTRLLTGCCIIKPDSADGYRQWYSPRLKPWEHYVPAAADLQDLQDRLDWCRSNTAEAARLAANGRALALDMVRNWEREMAAAAADIDNAHRDGRLATHRLKGVLP